MLAIQSHPIVVLRSSLKFFNSPSKTRLEIKINELVVLISQDNYFLYSFSSSNGL